MHGKEQRGHSVHTRFGLSASFRLQTERFYRSPRTVSEISDIVVGIILQRLRYTLLHEAAVKSSSDELILCSVLFYRHPRCVVSAYE